MWWQKLIDGYARNVVKTGEDAYRLTMGVAERRIPGGCAIDATCRIEQAEQTIRKGRDNQFDRARVPPANAAPAPLRIARGISAFWDHRHLPGAAPDRRCFCWLEKAGEDR